MAKTGVMALLDEADKILGKTPVADGATFGRWSVASANVAKDSHGRGKSLCRCVCGAVRVVFNDNLRRGVTLSCGCHKIDVAVRRSTTHGEAGRVSGETPEWKAWSGLRSRCNGPTNPKYPRYGGRGIAVCARWEKFENFLADMGRKPSRRHSIERKDNDGPYSPDNCVWALPHRQSRNKSSTVLLTHAGETMCTADWATRTGLRATTIRNRVHSGWSTARALTTPSRAPGKRPR